MARIRLCLVGAVALVAVSCQDHGPPTAVPPLISAEFRDAVHGGGNPHFYLLAPFVSRPDLTKETFESGLKPSVRITEMTAAGQAFAACTNEHIAYLPATEFTQLKAYAAFCGRPIFPTWRRLASTGSRWRCSARRTVPVRCSASRMCR